MVRVFEVFAAGFSILFAVFCESVVVSWIYGKQYRGIELLHTVCMDWLSIQCSETLSL